MVEAPTRIKSLIEVPRGDAVQLRGAGAALFQSTATEILVEGRAGTGKSIAVLTYLFHLAVNYPGARILIVRQTRESCTQSVLVTLEEKVLGPTHPVVQGAERPNRQEYRFPNGSVIVVGGLDKPDKLFSTEWDVIYINEATEITLDAYELFARALRNHKTPVQQRIADCNPGAPSHWLNKRATVATDKLRDASTKARYRALQRFNHGPQDGRMRRLISVHQDNPAYFDMQTWEWTLAGQNFLNNLKTMSGHRQQRMLMGRWVAAEGTVYPEFDESKHTIKPFPIPPEWPVCAGWDAGYDHPTAILWFAVGDNECLYVFDEIYEGGKSVAEHCASVHKRNAGRTVRRYYADPQHCFSQTAQAPKTIASQAKEAGITMTPWPRTGGNEESMVERVRERLRQGKLKVFTTCTNTIAEFQTWSYKRNPKGERLGGEDQFEDKNNDAMDVVKGVVATNPRYDVAGTKVYGV